jgi:hypothetical protein
MGDPLAGRRVGVTRLELAASELPDVVHHAIHGNGMIFVSWARIGHTDPLARRTSWDEKHGTPAVAGVPLALRG